MIKKEIKDYFIYYSIIFTVATIVSSIWQLSVGKITDTNYHILDRAVVGAIGIFTLYIVNYCKFNNKLLKLIVPYIISLPIVLLYTWATGFIDTLHPKAYRDITLNFSVLYLVVMFVININKKKK